jgi:hypothetical protein
MTGDEPKSPTLAPIGGMTLTGMGSSAVGDKLGDAFAQLVAWGIARYCACVPPDAVISAIHSICVAFVVGMAFYIHYRFIKTST